MPYAALLDDEVPVRGHPMAIPSMFVDHIDESVGATIQEGLNRSDSWFPFVQFRVLGGAISRVAPDAMTALTSTSSARTMAIGSRPGIRARPWHGCDGSRPPTTQRTSSVTTTTSHPLERDVHLRKVVKDNMFR
jgi:hypothetical protein